MHYWGEKTVRKYQAVQAELIRREKNGDYVEKRRPNVRWMDIIKEEMAPAGLQKRRPGKSGVEEELPYMET